MKSTHPSSHDAAHDPLTAALYAALLLEREHPDAVANEPPRPFVTISRQAGAGGKIFGAALVDRLNADLQEGLPWTLWHDTLVQKVSLDHALAQAYVEALEDEPHGWFSDFMRGLPFAGNDQRPEEFKVYRRVASTIRALARAGRAVIVGRGGAFITSDLPGGVHVRLIAPLPFRIRQIAQSLEISEHDAAARVAEIDLARAVFYRRYWPTKSTAAESFTMTLNSEKMDFEQMVDCVLPVLAHRAKPAAAARAHAAKEARPVSAGVA